MIVIHLDGDLYATRTQAADALRQAGQRVSPETIRGWDRRGRIRPVARVDGQPVYRMREVWRAERDTGDAPPDPAWLDKPRRDVHPVSQGPLCPQPGASAGLSHVRGVPADANHHHESAAATPHRRPAERLDMTGLEDALDPVMSVAAARAAATPEQLTRLRQVVPVAVSEYRAGILNEDGVRGAVRSVMGAEWEPDTRAGHATAYSGR